MMSLKNLQQPSEKINQRIRVVPVPLNRNKRKSYSALIAVEETISKKICFKLKRKEQPVNSTQFKKNVPPSTVASVSESPKNFEDTIAFVGTDDSKKIVTNNTILKISKIGTSICNLVVLLDTGIPISFISRQTFDNFFNLTDSSIISSCSYNALNSTLIQVKNLVTTSIELELLPKTVSTIF